MDDFETYRSYLFGVAYRMLGSTMDAEDMVQETYLRCRATPPERVASPKALLTTIITRLCVDQLHLARRKREQYLGPWLPEPLSTGAARELAQVEERVDAHESVSLAFLVLLEQLQPAERAVFLLREVFEYEYAEISDFLGKSEGACRQWFSRAKKHLSDHRPRFPASSDTQKRLLTGFVQAAHTGEMSAMTDLLAEDVTLWCDGGGKAPGAAMLPITGPVAVAGFFLSSGEEFRRYLPEGSHVEMEEVNGQPALVTRAGKRAFAVVTVEVEAGQIQAIRLVTNPEKLTHV